MPFKTRFWASELKTFRHDCRGSVAVIGAWMLPIVIGFSALALEYGSALQTRVENQRVADLASHAGAVTFGQTGSEAQMTQVAESIALLNGVARNDIHVTLEASPDTSGQAVRATITTVKPLLLARVLGTSQNLDVKVTALAGLSSSEPACILALSPSSTGLNLSGGTSLTAAECAVASNSTVTAPCGTRITTTAVIYNSDTPPADCNNIKRSDGDDARITRAETVDPLAGHAAVAAADARLARVAAMTPVAAPSVPGGRDIEFGWSEAATQAQAKAVGCAADKSGSIWTLTCSGRTSYNFGNITIGGGLELRFNPGGPETAVYNVSGFIRNAGGSTMQFGSGSYNVAKGIVSQGGATTRFGAGTYRIGRADTACDWTGGRYSLCNQSTLSFEGPSTFEFAGGVLNGGGARLSLGGGTANSFRIGPSSDGNAFFLGGGSHTVLAEATGPDSAFELAGNVHGGGGGSCLTLGAARQHDIKGHVSLAGGIVLGAGPYTVDGYLHFGSNGGGAAQCNGTTVSVKAEGVSFALSGRGAPVATGSCGNQAFCVGAGYSGIRLQAPDSGPFERFAVIGPTSASVTAGAALGQGASGSRISGAFYFPYGPFAMSGGASASDVPGDCFQVVADRITLSGGATAASECVAGAGGASGQVRLLR